MILFSLNNRANCCMHGERRSLKLKLGFAKIVSWEISAFASPSPPVPFFPRLQLQLQAFGCCRYRIFAWEFPGLNPAYRDISSRKNEDEVKQMAFFDTAYHREHQTFFPRTYKFSVSDLCCQHGISVSAHFACFILPIKSTKNTCKQ